MSTRNAWAIDFLAALGNTMPDAATIKLVASWTKAEGTEAKYNPLATTQAYAGATNFNSVGVKNYASRADGIAASILTIRQDHPGYADLRIGLATNQPEKSLYSGGFDTWGSGTAAVTSIYRGADVGEEVLASEPANEVAIPPAGSPIALPIPSASTPATREPMPAAPPVGPFSTDILSSFFKQVLGWLLIGVGALILVVQAVQSDAAKQAAKTAATVAAVAG